MPEILAFDNGFGWTKALTPRGRMLLPSLVGAAETIRFESKVIAENERGVAVAVDGEWLFVGQQAELQSSSTQQTLDATRTGTREQKALFYAVC